MNPDSKVMQALALAADVVLVNVLLILTSLPVVTAGAVLAASHATLLELINDEGSGVVRTYLRHFRASWKAATLGWFIVLGAGLLLAWEFWALGRMDGWGALAAQTGVIVGVLLLAIWAVWFFPLAGKALPFRRAGKLAALLGVGHLPRTALALVFLTIPALLLYLDPSIWAIWLAAMAILGFALPLYLVILVIRGPLSRVA